MARPANRPCPRCYLRATVGGARVERRGELVRVCKLCAVQLAALAEAGVRDEDFDPRSLDVSDELVIA